MKRSVCIILCLITLCNLFAVFSSAQMSLVDVSHEDWFYIAVDEPYRRGIMTGVSAESFAP